MLFLFLVDNFTRDNMQPGLINPAIKFPTKTVKPPLCYLNSAITLLHRCQIINDMFDDHGLDREVFAIFRYRQN
jgi:hypothetical protein